MEKPSRFTATPAEIMAFLREHFAQDRLQAFQWAIGDAAILEGVGDLKRYQEKFLSRESVGASPGMIAGWEAAGEYLADNVHYPATFRCGKHDGFNGTCPGVPRCQ